MRDRWVGKRIDLNLLSECLAQFFEGKGFLSLVESRSANEHRIIVVPRRTSNLCENINVFVRGEPCDFVIEFVAGSRSRLFMTLGGLMTLFGGGFLLCRGIKSREELERLEREFWRFVDEKIDSLSKFRGLL